MARSVQPITRHLRNIFAEGELNEKSICSVLEHVSTTRRRSYQTKLYNLDAIISVGYRVNSKRATKFHQWATKTLRDHLVKGFTINENRLAQVPVEKIKEFEDAIKLLESARQKTLSKSEAEGLLDVITSYAKTWLVLERHDKRKLQATGTQKRSRAFDPIAAATTAIAELKKKLIMNKEATDLFGRERQTDSLIGIFGNIEQSFGGHSAIQHWKKKPRIYYISS